MGGIKIANEKKIKIRCGHFTCIKHLFGVMYLAVCSLPPCQCDMRMRYAQRKVKEKNIAQTMRLFFLPREQSSRDRCREQESRLHRSIRSLLLLQRPARPGLSPIAHEGQSTPSLLSSILPWCHPTKQVYKDERDCNKDQYKMSTDYYMYLVVHGNLQYRYYYFSKTFIVAITSFEHGFSILPWREWWRWPSSTQSDLWA